MAINLIPQEQKNRLKLEIVKNKVWAVLGFFVLGLVIFALTLVYLDTLISKKVVCLNDSVKEKRAYMASDEFLGMKAEISAANQGLSFANKLWQEQVFFGKLLEKTSLLTPNSIYYNKAGLTKGIREVDIGEGQKEIQFFITVNLSGVSRTRDNLYDFRKILLFEKTFEHPYFAPFSWKKAENGEFFLDLTYYELNP